MNFQHEILFEVDTDAPKTEIKISINNEIKWKDVLESKSHKYKVTFDHDYKLIIQFEFSIS